MSDDEDAISVWRQLQSPGGRKRLPNGFWAGRGGKRRAVFLLRYAVKKRLAEVLRCLKLDSAAQVCFGGSHAKYMAAAFPRLRLGDIRDAREQYAKKKRFFRRIDTEKKAYFLGLLATDGNVSGNTVSLALKARDRVLLERFEQAIGFRPSVIRPMLKGMLRTSVTCAAMARDLARWCVVPNKTKRLRWPTGLPKRLLSHFIRGVLDGDGSVSAKGQWTIVSASHRFIRVLKRRLDRIAGRSLPLNRTGKNKKSRVISGARGDWAVLDWLYRDATVFLPRKHRNYLAGRPCLEVQPVRVVAKRRGRRVIAQDGLGRFSANGHGRPGVAVFKGAAWRIRCSACPAVFERPASAVRGRRYVFCVACIRKGRVQKTIHTRRYFERRRRLGLEAAC